MTTTELIWILRETIKTLEKSTITKSTIESGTTKTDVDDMTRTSEKDFGIVTATDKTIRR